MKAAGARKYLEAEKADHERLRAKKQAGKDEVAEAVDAAQQVPSDTGLPKANLEAEGAPTMHEPMSAEEGIEVEDTSFL